MATEVWAIAMVKDEADVILESAGRMLEQVDHVLIADNQSTDGTRELLEQLGVEVVDDTQAGYYQAQKMTALAARAAAAGAAWVVPFDADEVWYSPHGRIADVLAGVDAAVAAATVYDHVATGEDFNLPPIGRMPYRRRAPLGLPKVACRAAVPVAIAQGNHGADYDTRLVHGLLEVRHFPYRSPGQFVSKARNGAAAYAATDLPDDVGAHWRQYGRHLAQNGEQALIDDVFRPHFWVADPAADPDLVYDPCPA